MGWPWAPYSLESSIHQADEQHLPQALPSVPWPSPGHPEDRPGVVLPTRPNSLHGGTPGTQGTRWGKAIGCPVQGTLMQLAADLDTRSYSSPRPATFLRKGRAGQWPGVNTQNPSPSPALKASGPGRQVAGRDQMAGIRQKFQD